MLDLPADSLNYSVILIALAILQGSLVLILVYLFVRKVLKARKDKVDEEVTKQEAYTKALSVLEEAKEESLRILNTSHEKARQVLSNSKSLTEDSKKILDQKLEQLSQKYTQDMENVSRSLSEAFRSALEAEKDRGVSEIHEVSEELKKELVEEVGDFKDVLHKETVEAERGIRDEIVGDFEQMKKELETYKKERTESINRNMYELLAKISKDVLGKTLTIDEHEELVLQAIKDAKKEGTFLI
ncbi:MAG: hypothetical protein PVJ52_03170 [Candidatus Woesebacteria bacterium]|jgi:F0F1-type ATP synthase membrane subunit b/b'